jgi:hypothetical protein
LRPNAPSCGSVAGTGLDRQARSGPCHGDPAAGVAQRLPRKRDRSPRGTSRVRGRRPTRLSRLVAGTRRRCRCVGPATSTSISAQAKPTSGLSTGAVSTSDSHRKSKPWAPSPSTTRPNCAGDSPAPASADPYLHRSVPSTPLGVGARAETPRLGIRVEVFPILGFSAWVRDPWADYALAPEVSDMGSPSTLPTGRFVGPCVSVGSSAKSSPRRVDSIWSGLGVG